MERTVSRQEADGTVSRQELDAEGREVPSLGRGSLRGTTTVINNKRSAPVGIKFPHSGLEDGPGAVDITLQPGINALNEEQARQWEHAKQHKMIRLALHPTEGHLVEMDDSSPEAKQARADARDADEAADRAADEKAKVSGFDAQGRPYKLDAQGLRVDAQGNQLPVDPQVRRQVQSDDRVAEKLAADKAGAEKLNADRAKAKK